MKTPDVKEGYVEIFPAWFRTRNGKKIYAKDYGKKTFRFLVKKK